MFRQIIHFSCIIMLLAAVSCKKDKDLKIEEKYVIQGKILEDTINWRINTTTVQPVTTGAGYYNDFDNQPNTFKPFFMYSHISSKNVIQQVRIFSPAYKVDDSLAKKEAIYAVGKKDFTDENVSKLTGFAIEVDYKGQTFTSSLGSQEGKLFEITDVTFAPYDTDTKDYIVARTMVSINCSLYDANKNYVGEIKNLKAHADFRFRK